MQESINFKKKKFSIISEKQEKKIKTIKHGQCATKGKILTFTEHLLYAELHSLSSDTQSCPTLCIWAVAWQASLSMGFSRQEYWSELPFPATKKKGEEAIKEF